MQYKPEDEHAFRNRNFIERDEFLKQLEDRIKKGPVS
jgi:hypothetical protein